jgi:4-amino-4-deoxy-L-arabinose transferase-like glycosyltransferase
MRNLRLIRLVRRMPFIAALILLLGGAVYCAYLGTTLRFLPDESDYLTLARNLVSQRAFTLDGATPTAFRPPGYPLVLAAGMLIGLDVAELRWLNFVLLAGSLLLLASLVRRMAASAWAACIACGLFACYPVLIYTAGTFYPQTLAGFLLLLCIWALPLTAAESAKPARLVISGLALGLLVLTA